MSGSAGNITIDGDRMWASIVETAQIGATSKGGKATKARRSRSRSSGAADLPTSGSRFSSPAMCVA